MLEVHTQNSPGIQRGMPINIDYGHGYDHDLAVNQAAPTAKRLSSMLDAYFRKAAAVVVESSQEVPSLVDSTDSGESADEGGDPAGKPADPAGKGAGGGGEYLMPCGTGGCPDARGRKLVNALHFSQLAFVGSDRERRLLCCRERHREQLEKFERGHREWLEKRLNFLCAQYLMRVLKRAARKVCQAGSAADHAAPTRAAEVRRTVCHCAGHCPTDWATVKKEMLMLMECEKLKNRRIDRWIRLATKGVSEGSSGRRRSTSEIHTARRRAQAAAFALVRDAEQAQSAAP